MVEANAENVKEDSDLILIKLRERFRGGSLLASGIASVTPNVIVTLIITQIAIVLWHISTWFHPTKARVLDSPGDFDGRWINLKGKFFGRPFEITI